MGFRTSRSKTEFMQCNLSGRGSDSRDEVKLGDYLIQEVTSFNFLEMIIQNKGEIEEDVSHRIQARLIK